MNKRQIIITSAEGGKDAKMFAKDLILAYSKLAIKKGWNCT